MKHFLNMLVDTMDNLQVHIISVRELFEMIRSIGNLAYDQYRIGRDEHPPYVMEMTQCFTLHVNAETGTRTMCLLKNGKCTD
jgi:hypothetical protein